jgi:hypothetical protein
VLALEAGSARVVVDPEGGGRIERLDVDGLMLLVPAKVEPLSQVRSLQYFFERVSGCIKFLSQFFAFLK